MAAGLNPVLSAIFQPTRPLRGATTQNTPRKSFCWRFQPTRPLRGATRRCCREVTAVVISTHAPLAGRDFLGWCQVFGNPISTHAPLAGRDRPDLPLVDLRLISTHASLAGRDELGMLAGIKIKDFNPRAPCGARRRQRAAETYHAADFNPRAPCGARQRVETPRTAPQDFNPRAPCGARPGACVPLLSAMPISTHAPLAGRDRSRFDGSYKIT